MTKKRATIIWLCILAISFVWAIIYGMGLHDYIPRLRASAVSPDAAFVVKVYEKRLMPRPLFPRMGATAEVYDSGGNLVYEKLIYNDDDWDDTVGTAFSQISFVGDEIHVGPGAYDPKQIHIIKMSDLKLPAAK
jgi:hypothetical protein